MPGESAVPAVISLKFALLLVSEPVTGVSLLVVVTLGLLVPVAYINVYPVIGSVPGEGSHVRVKLLSLILVAITFVGAAGGVVIVKGAETAEDDVMPARLASGGVLLRAGMVVVFTAVIVYLVLGVALVNL